MNDFIINNYDLIIEMCWLVGSIAFSVASVMVILIVGDWIRNRTIFHRSHEEIEKVKAQQDQLTGFYNNCEASIGELSDINDSREAAIDTSQFKGAAELTTH